MIVSALCHCVPMLIFSRGWVSLWDMSMTLTNQKVKSKEQPKLQGKNIFFLLTVNQNHHNLIKIYKWKVSPCWYTWPFAAPPMPTFTERTETTVTFRYENQQGISKYEFEWRDSANMLIPTTCDSGAYTCSVSGLQPATAYTLKQQVCFNLDGSDICNTAKSVQGTRPPCEFYVNSSDNAKCEQMNAVHVRSFDLC